MGRCGIMQMQNDANISTDLQILEAKGKGTKAGEGKCGNVKRGLAVTRLFLWLARTR